QGAYTTALEKEFRGTKTSIFSFEPSPTSFALLRAQAGAKENISLHNIALGEHHGTQTLYADTPGSSLASLTRRRLDHFHLTMDATETVTVKTLDAFCEEHKIPRIHFLKMDVEGQELSVLRGGGEMIASGAIDFIQFEFGGCNIDSRTYFQDFYYLLAPQYNLYRIVKDGLFPLHRYQETYEVFVTTNFLAKRKNLPGNHAI
ncbi:MAG: FkbM family methyltransferase, partial [Patescibacteria group bacterium]